MSYFAPPRPRIFGHRGAAGVAPENTDVSFTVAVALGVAYLELDVHATSDGTIVVLHDATLERTTDGEGPITGISWVELERLDAGYRFSTDGLVFPYRGQGVRVPRLESILCQFPTMRFNIEIKQADPPIVDAVMEIIGRTGAGERVLLAAEQDRVMESIRARTGGHVATGSSTGEVVEFVRRLERDDWQGYHLPGQAIQVPVQFGSVQLVTPESLAAAHRLGAEMHVWTINDPGEIKRLLELGVDGIMSDFPGLAVHEAAHHSLGH